MTKGRTGLFHNMLQNLSHWVAEIGTRTNVYIDKNTFKVRVFPDNGVAPHVDLDYVVQYMQNPMFCVSCGGTLSDEQQQFRGGIHIPECAGIPSTPTVFTIAVNIGEHPIAFISFGPPCKIARRSNKSLIPKISKRKVSMVPCTLEPGQAVIFSAWVMHESTPSGLQGTRISIDVRVRPQHNTTGNGLV